MWRILGVYWEYTRSILGVYTGSIYWEYTGSTLGVHWEYTGSILGVRVADPYTLYTDPDPAFSKNFGSGSGSSVLIFAVHFFGIFEEKKFYLPGIGYILI